MDRPLTRSQPLSVPNLLTYARLVAVPTLAAVMFFLEGDMARWLAVVVFAFAGITDFLDGYIARAWGQQSPLGRMLDPIADKLLVGAALLLLVADQTISGWSIWAALTILSREILVSGLREFLAELNVRVAVSRLAKWKTTVQMIALSRSARRQCGRRSVRVRRGQYRPCAAVAGGDADALHRPRLFPRRPEICDHMSGMR